MDDPGNDEPTMEDFLAEAARLYRLEGLQVPYATIEKRAKELYTEYLAACDATFKVDESAQSQHAPLFSRPASARPAATQPAPSRSPPGDLSSRSPVGAEQDDSQRGASKRPRAESAGGPSGGSGVRSPATASQGVPSSARPSVCALPLCPLNPNCSKDGKAPEKGYFGFVEADVLTLFCSSCNGMVTTMDRDANVSAQRARPDAFRVALEQWLAAGSSTTDVSAHTGFMWKWALRSTSKAPSKSLGEEWQKFNRYCWCRSSGKHCTAAIRLQYVAPADASTTELRESQVVRVAYVGDHLHALPRAPARAVAPSPAQGPARVQQQHAKERLSNGGEASMRTPGQQAAAVADRFRSSAALLQAEEPDSRPYAAAMMEREDGWQRDTMAVLAQPSAEYGTGVWHFQLATDSFPCFIVAAVASGDIFAKLHALLPPGDPLVFYVNGTCKTQRTAPFLQVSLVTVSYGDALYTLASFFMDARLHVDHSMLWDIMRRLVRDIDRRVVVVTDCEPALLESTKESRDFKSKTWTHVMCRTHARAALNQRVKEEQPLHASELFKAQKIAKLFVGKAWTTWLHCATQEAALAFFAERIAELGDIRGTARRMRPFVLFALEIDAMGDAEVLEYATVLAPAVRRVFAYVEKQWVPYAASLCAFGVPAALFSAGPRGSNSYAETAGQRWSAFLGQTGSITDATTLVPALVDFLAMENARFEVVREQQRSRAIKPPTSTPKSQQQSPWKGLSFDAQAARQRQRAATRKKLKAANNDNNNNNYKNNNNVFSDVDDDDDYDDDDEDEHEDDDDLPLSD